jgi:hypothetical protein
MRLWLAAVPGGGQKGEPRPSMRAFAPAWLVSMVVCAWAPAKPSTMTETPANSIHQEKERPAESAPQTEQAARMEADVGRNSGKDVEGFEIMEIKRTE